MTPEELAQQQRIAAATRQFQDILTAMTKMSSTQADASKRVMDNVNRTFSNNATQLADNIRSVSDVLGDNRIQRAADRERDMWEKRVNNQMHFFNNEGSQHDKFVKQRADALRNERESADDALRRIKKQREKELDQATRLLETNRKRAREGEKQIIATDKNINSKRASIDAQRAAAAALVDAAAKDHAEQEIRAEENKLQKLIRHSKELHREYDDEIAARNEGIAGLKAHSAATRSTRKAIAELEAKSTMLKIAENNATIEMLEGQRNPLKNAWKSVIDGLNKLVSPENLSAFGKGMAIAGGKGYIDAGRASINNSMAMPGVSEQLSIGTTTGMSTQDFMNMTSEYRRSMIAAGGLGDSMKILSENSELLKGDIASLADRAKFTMQSMEMLTNTGIRPTVANAARMAKLYSNIHQSTGMTSEQFTTSMRDIMESEATLQTMRMANTEEERQAITDSIASRVEENRKRGISEAQSQAIIKQQMKDANQRPLSRYQKAIKEAAFAGAMGIQGGQQAIQRSMKAKVHWTAEDHAADQEYKNQMAQASERGLSGSFPTQLITEQLQDKLAPDTVNSVYNTKLAEPMARVMESGAKSFGEVNKTVIAANQKLEEALGALKTPLAQLGIGITAMVAGMVGQSIMVSRNIFALKENTLALMSQRGDGQNFPGGPDGDKNKNKNKPKGSKGGWKGGVVKGGVGLVAGYALDKTSEHYTEKAQKTGDESDVQKGKLADTASYAAGGAGLGAMIGGIGGLGVASWLTAPVGAAIGGGLGTAYGAYKNWGQDETTEEKEAAGERAAIREANVKAESIKTELVNSEYTAKVKTEAAEKAAAIQLTAERTIAQIKTPPSTNISVNGTTDTPADDNASKSKASQDKIKARGDIETQLRKMDDANNYLKTVAENVPTLVDLASKQLAVATMSEKEKEKNKDTIRRSVGFAASSYSYI